MNEVLFFSFLLGGLGLVLLASYFGRPVLYTVLISLSLFVVVTEPHVVNFFGLQVGLATIAYSIIYFCSDIITERYGKRAGFAAVQYAIFAIVIFQILMQFSLLTDGAPSAANFSEALNEVFGGSLRVIAATVFTLAVAQSFNVYLYSKLRVVTEGRHLWIRNNASTIFSQAIASLMFYFLAFYGEDVSWFSLAITGFWFKVIVAVLDTPFMYASTFILPRDYRHDKPGERRRDDRSAASLNDAEDSGT